MNKVFSWLKNHVPEILTVTAVVAIPVGDYFLVKGVEEDSKEKKIAGGIIHAGSAACIIASNRVSNYQKLSLIAAGTASATEFQRYRDTVKEEVGEEKYEEIEKVYSGEDIERLMIEADEADELNGTELHRKTLYYFPQIRKMIQCDPDSLSVAILNLNEFYQEYGEASINNFFNFISPDILKNDPDLKENGKEFGWMMYDDDPEAGFTQIVVNQYSKKTRSGVHVTYVYFYEQPLKFEEWEQYYDKLYTELEKEENLKYVSG